MRTSLLIQARKTSIRIQQPSIYQYLNKTTTNRKMSSGVNQAVNFSSNADPGILSPKLESLINREGGEGGRWRLTESGKGLERSFKFKTFKKTWEFMNTVAAECAVQKHHPEWSNVYNTTFIRWTTHSPPGLSEKDISMAKFCDEQATLHGEVDSSGSEVGKELADRVAVEGGDCCVPKKKTT